MSQSRRSYRARQTHGIGNELYLSHEMALDRPALYACLLR